MDHQAVDHQVCSLHRGRAFNRNTLRALLSNVIYTGQVRCNGQLYPGEQEAIVDCELWNGVNQLLGAIPQRVPRIEKLTRSGDRAVRPSPPDSSICESCMQTGKAGTAAGERPPRIARLL